jgi:hypothetical protein
MANVVVRLLTPGAKVQVQPQDGFEGCAVFVPGDPSHQKAGTPLRLALFVGGKYTAGAVPFTVPNGGNSVAIDLPDTLSLTPKWVIEDAIYDLLLAKGALPGPPVVVT